MAESSHRASGLQAFAAVMIVTSTLSILFRFWSRIVHPGVRLGLDDWFALAAWPLAISVGSLVIVSVSRGAGQHSDELSTEDSTLLSQYLFAGNALFALSISFCKISALFFYRRVLRLPSIAGKAWGALYYATLTLAGAWPVAFIIFTAFRCSPVRKSWESELPGTCIGYYSYFMSSVASSVTIDLLVLLLPIPQIWRLNIDRQRKLMISTVFFFGYSAAFMSIGRLVTTGVIGERLETDLNYELIPGVYWALAENSLSIFAVSLPAIYQLGKRLRDFGAKGLVSSYDFHRARESNRFRQLSSSGEWWGVGGEGGKGSGGGGGGGGTGGMAGRRSGSLTRPSSSTRNSRGSQWRGGINGALYAQAHLQSSGNQHYSNDGGNDSSGALSMWLDSLESPDLARASSDRMMIMASPTSPASPGRWVLFADDAPIRQEAEPPSVQP